MTRTSDRKSEEERKDVFLRLIIRGFTDSKLNPNLVQEMDDTVFDIFGDVARDGIVSKDNVYGKTHFSYILLKNTAFIGELTQKQEQLRNNIDWISEINVQIESTKITMQEFEKMELLKQDINLSSLFSLKEDVKDNMDDDKT